MHMAVMSCQKVPALTSCMTEAMGFANTLQGRHALYDSLQGLRAIPATQ
jgi:hypothetical protein